MEDLIIEEILASKNKSIKDLLTLTESPIERRFLLEFIKYLEKLLSYCDPTEPIDGYRYIMEAADEFGTKYTGRTLGLSISSTSEYILIETDAFEVSKAKVSSTKRKIQKIELSPNHFLCYQRMNFYPQYEVEVNGKFFRLDFAFLLDEATNKSRNLVRKIGIECDGYEYHSNPIQFKKDRERSRILLADDWTILQYSGSEINNLNFSYETEFNKIFSMLGFSSLSVRREE